MPALIVDEATPLIDTLIKKSGGYANEALSHAGLHLRSKMIDRARAYDNVPYGQEIKNGYRRLLGTQRGGGKPAFKRIDRLNGGNAQGGEFMQSLIRSRVSEKSHKLIIGYAAVKGFTTQEWKDGVKQNKGKYIKGVGRNFKEIGEKLEFGGARRLSAREKRLFQASGWTNAARKGVITYQARPIINPVFTANRGQVVKIFEQSIFGNIRKLNGK